MGDPLLLLLHRTGWEAEAEAEGRSAEVKTDFVRRGERKAPFKLFKPLPSGMLLYRSQYIFEIHGLIRKEALVASSKGP